MSNTTKLTTGVFASKLNQILVQDSSGQTFTVTPRNNYLLELARVANSYEFTVKSVRIFKDSALVLGSLVIHLKTGEEVKSPVIHGAGSSKNSVSEAVITAENVLFKRCCEFCLINVESQITDEILGKSNGAIPANQGDKITITPVIPPATPLLQANVATSENIKKENITVDEGARKETEAQEAQETQEEKPVIKDEQPAGYGVVVSLKTLEERMHDPAIKNDFEGLKNMLMNEFKVTREQILNGGQRVTLTKCIEQLELIQKLYAEGSPGITQIVEANKQKIEAAKLAGGIAVPPLESTQANTPPAIIPTENQELPFGEDIQTDKQQPATAPAETSTNLLAAPVQKALEILESLPEKRENWDMADLEMLFNTVDGITSSALAFAQRCGELGISAESVDRFIYEGSKSDMIKFLTAK